MVLNRTHADHEPLSHTAEWAEGMVLNHTLPDHEFCHTHTAEWAEGMVLNHTHGRASSNIVNPNGTPPSES
jgi:hypothetical protein